MVKKFNIVLDLDQTLISSEDLKDFVPDQKKMSHFKHAKMDNSYITFERPHLQEFLDFLFKNYNVSIWTAATKNYALFIINKFIRKRGRNIDFIFFSYHCEGTNQGSILHTVSVQNTERTSKRPQKMQGGGGGPKKV